MTARHRRKRRRLRGRSSSRAYSTLPTKDTAYSLVRPRSDLLDKLFNVAATKDDFSLADVTTEAWVSLFAGSDTTAIAMRSILCNIIKNPEVYKKVTAEIDDATTQSKLSTPVKYSEAIRLPYFVACCKEGFRVHPSVGMSMPRHAPPSGATIASRYFKGGSRVGMSASVLHFDKDIFGGDADRYNPDRWLQPDADVMERYMMHFGAGPHTCVGKNVCFTIRSYNSRLQLTSIADISC